MIFVIQQSVSLKVMTLATRSSTYLMTMTSWVNVVDTHFLEPPGDGRDRGVTSLTSMRNVIVYKSSFFRHENVPKKILTSLLQHEKHEMNDVFIVGVIN